MTKLIELSTQFIAAFCPLLELT